MWSLLSTSSTCLGDGRKRKRASDSIGVSPLLQTGIPCQAPQQPVPSRMSLRPPTRLRVSVPQTQAGQRPTCQVGCLSALPWAQDFAGRAGPGPPLEGHRETSQPLVWPTLGRRGNPTSPQTGATVPAPPGRKPPLAQAGSARGWPRAARPSSPVLPPDTGATGRAQPPGFRASHP